MEENNYNRKEISIIDKLIDAKKLQFNHIWANKITQEDLNIPRLLDESKMNIILLKNLVNSILNFANHLTQLFDKVFSGSDDYKELLNVSNALLHKINCFNNIRTKSVKMSKETLEPLIRLQNFYKMFISNINPNELSKRMEEIYLTINDFNINMLD